MSDPQIGRFDMVNGVYGRDAENLGSRDVRKVHLISVAAGEFYDVCW